MEPTSSPSLRSRRALIVAGLGGLSATAAHALGRPMSAQAGHGTGVDPDGLHLGKVNTTDAETTLLTNLPEGTPGDPIAVQVAINKGRALNGAASIGVGVWGVSIDGDQDHPHVGVEGVAENNGAGVRGQSKGPFGTPGGSGPGVVGESSTGAGVQGFSESGPGVSGSSNEGVGVSGAGKLFSVFGYSVEGIGGEFVSEGAPGTAGMRAFTPGDRPAVQAVSGFEAGNPEEDGGDGGLALDVIGKARFSTAGSASVAAGQNTAVVANPAATASSHISVTLVGDPGPRQLRWVQRSPGVGFTVHFSGGPPGQRPEVPFTYLIVEPA